MFKILLFILPVVGFIWFKKNKIKIKFKTFLRKGFKPNRGIFGIYCYCGKQGSGKTYSVIEYLNNNKDKEIYANLKRIDGVEYTKLESFEDLIKLKDRTDIVIFYDEIFTALTKHTQISKEVLSFMSQMRKRRIILLTTAQEWAELPLTWRRYCRYQINCRLIRIPFFKGILIKNILDAENMKWDTDSNDFIAPLIENTVTHTQKHISDCYDTWETIDT